MVAPLDFPGNCPLGSKRLNHGRYRLVKHDPHWLTLAHEDIERLRPIFDHYLIQAHHVGSTAIPSIMAKPILDFAAEVSDLRELDVRRSQFEARGYVWRGEYGIPGRRYIRPDDNRVHWHCFAQGSKRLHEHLAFRDFLRACPDKAKAYEIAKIDAMAQHNAGRSSYLDEKSPTLEALLVEALAWAAKCDAGMENGEKVEARQGWFNKPPLS